ncbi:peptidyl-prolyl cis-trans isomerase CYP21-2-like [Portunus trituberculatus]|uniref:peptidyl-prolyl cis-trans isomerase CYP21-2-like n=1 Tax=Portunus trituberculatus TaxID=210409 RepID=UPI001E1D01A8|nr:peptidyl-prolyl cis-trans isomerase CYP21-2-like [Portunus trituberculatus]XP_045123131.1 peptidyl-prolyl cis-trans isomerase CYP21-2-like [Portunus trituberculatus]XP_045123132.1 peptidyl-prolyl cis-trans isomerase CYP21-2-like [Portunus trituberculatus]XP_045123133.1 peptidyl-prolyl cis-trans isomerase CYP21-2-like [Portunus trituberculatus]
MAAAAASTMESVGAEELLRLTQRARDLVEAGRVLAVQDVKGQRRHARISLEDGRLHLYSLQDTPPSPDALILQMGEVVPATPPCEVFLDLSWPGSEARRVVVSLPRNNPSGRQFVLLCSGERGACYANTKMHMVVLEGEPGECVWGGDYENNTGKGGAALLPELDVLEYWRSGKAGAVGGPKYNLPRGAQFSITTKDQLPGDREFPGMFGEVVSGLEVVQEAAKHDPITEVTVEQCGVLLPQQ